MSAQTFVPLVRAIIGRTSKHMPNWKPEFFEAILTIGEAGVISQVELGRKLELNTVQVSRLVRKLRGKKGGNDTELHYRGFIKLSDDDVADGRSKMLALGEQGKAMYADLRRTVEKWSKVK